MRNPRVGKGVKAMDLWASLRSYWRARSSLDCRVLACAHSHAHGARGQRGGAQPCRLRGRLYRVKPPLAGLFFRGGVAPPVGGVATLRCDAALRPVPARVGCVFVFSPFTRQEMEHLLGGLHAHDGCRRRHRTGRKGFGMQPTTHGWSRESS